MKDTSDDKKLTKKEAKLEKELAELTSDLQRVQADFMNYRRRVDEERRTLTEAAKATTVMKLLPIIDNIERAVGHLPTELAGNTWAEGVVSLTKGLERALKELGLERIDASLGTIFDPNLHEAIMLEDGEGDEEVVSEELRAGYRLGSQVVRHSMVKVRHQPASLEHSPHHVVEEQLQEEPAEQEHFEE